MKSLYTTAEVEPIREMQKDWSDEQKERPIVPKLDLLKKKLKETSI